MPAAAAAGPASAEPSPANPQGPEAAPLTDAQISTQHGKHARADNDDPAATDVIDELLERDVDALVYPATAENVASEQAARMVAMKSATDNAGNVIAELRLVYNKTRQAAITKELSEIVAGAAAV